MRCVCPKRWQRLHSIGHFVARYNYNEIRRPLISVSDRTSDTSGLRATNKMKGGWEGGPWRCRDRGGQIAAACLPEHRCSGIPAPL